MTTAELLNRSENPTRELVAAEPTNHAPLFASPECDNLRADWKRIQGDFVDDPRKAVEQADGLVASTIQRLAQVFADEKGRMEETWAKGQDVSTEDLRQALRRYRSFFDRLLNV